MLVDLQIGSADVCRLNKHKSNFLYLILIAPLRNPGNNYFSSSPGPRTLLMLFNVDIPSPSDFLLAMFELIMNLL